MIRLFTRAALAAAALVLLVVVPAVAHVTSERTRYSDIAESDARFDIMYLAGIGILPDEADFRPDANLTKADLAAWAVLASHLSSHHETPDAAGLAQEAPDNKLIDSIEGDATFADLSNVLFKGAVTAETPDATPTRAQAAQFIVANIAASVDGVPLLETWKASEGANGPVTAIATETTASGGTVFNITIGDQTLPAHAHIKIANGRTDLATWEGRTVARSLVREEEGVSYWIYLEANEADPEAEHETHGGGHH